MVMVGILTVATQKRRGAAMSLEMVGAVARNHVLIALGSRMLCIWYALGAYGTCRCHRGSPRVRRSPLAAFGRTTFPRFIVTSTVAPTFSLVSIPATTVFSFIKLFRCLRRRCFYHRSIGVIVAFLFLHAASGCTTAAHCCSNASKLRGLSLPMN
jgi:hypothetical protein